MSCFSCKLKERPTRALRHAGRTFPVLEMMEQADAIIFGSPVYYSNVTPEMLALEQRFLFCHMLYNKENRWVFPRRIPTAFIYTFGVTADQTEKVLAPFAVIHARMSEMLGVQTEICCSANAWQFKDYSLYEPIATIPPKREVSRGSLPRRLPQSLRAGSPPRACARLNRNRTPPPPTGRKEKRVCFSPRSPYDALNPFSREIPPWSITSFRSKSVRRFFSISL